MLVGLEGSVIGGNKEIGEELKDEFRMVRIGEANDRKECGDDKEIKDTISELALINMLIISEGARPVSLISGSFHVGEKIIIPTSRTGT